MYLVVSSPTTSSAHITERAAPQAPLEVGRMKDPALPLNARLPAVNVKLFLNRHLLLSPNEEFPGSSAEFERRRLSLNGCYSYLSFYLYGCSDERKFNYQFIFIHAPSVKHVKKYKSNADGDSSYKLLVHVVLLVA